MNQDDTPTLRWQWSTFHDLTPDMIYQVLQIRTQVFVVEQNCIYQDIDGLDPSAWHLLGWLNSETDTPSTKAPQAYVAAYLRVIPAGMKFSEAAIGRVLTAKSARASGYGHELLKEGIKRTEGLYPTAGIRISAQEHLEHFYAQHGFKTVSDVYDEDGIPHIEMLSVQQKV